MAAGKGDRRARSDREFHQPGTDLCGLRLVEVSLNSWRPERRFDLITCVHGLHYVGDKLRLVARAASWPTEYGLFVAGLDLHNLKFADGRPSGRRMITDLRRAGLEYDRRRRLVTCRGRRIVDLPYRYIGADDRAGPNYTGQPAVDSYYEPDPPRCPVRTGSPSPLQPACRRASEAIALVSSK